MSVYLLFECTEREESGVKGVVYLNRGDCSVISECSLAPETVEPSGECRPGGGALVEIPVH